MWQTLIETLDKLGGAYGNLIELGEKKRSSLINVDLEKLSRVLDEEKLLATEIQKLEQNRIDIFKSLLKSKITLNESISAKDFYRSAPSPVVEKKLFKMHERLVENVQHALRLRDDNQVLAQVALDAAQRHLNKIGGAAVEPTYSGKGSDVVTHRKNFDFEA